jgi:hypothetical protein
LVVHSEVHSEVDVLGRPVPYEVVVVAVVGLPDESRTVWMVMVIGEAGGRFSVIVDRGGRWIDPLRGVGPV